jgi:FkbM family methyltransferase
MKIKQCKHAKMAYLPNDIYIGGSIDAYGEQHETELSLLFQLVKEGDTVIDVGANIGTITIPLAKHVGKSGKVISFEPQSKLFELLSKNVELNELKNVEVNRKPVGRSSGLTTCVPELDYDAVHNFGSTNMQSENGEPLKTVCLDEFVEKIPKPSLIKLDAEGMEDEILLGSKKLINWARPYINLEFTDNHLAILHTLKGLDYQYRVFEPPVFNPDNVAGNKNNIFGRNLVSLNIVCWPSEKNFDFKSEWFPDVWKNSNPLNSRHLMYRQLELDFSEEYLPLNKMMSKANRREQNISELKFYSD